ncbi:polysaccharide biosynthesis protein [Solibacillus isronensis]|uniref:polysaccharide biosynthesis protein n=1 Tax=Solibacillus isronensis TaxID=412383 RepID=UPI00203C82DB|nr:nucleoside-diphosphate sugar epimerase/dehydratase [Solibacillus isronensis]MCM3722114.1 polysaccharide biosynthesis protein [Solibacillus isronensis]
MNYRRRYAVFFILDSIIVLTAIYISYWLLHPTVSVYTNKTLFISAITLLIAHHIVANIYKLYSRIWAVASIRELIIIGVAVTISVVMAMIMQQLINGDIYFRVLMITWLLHIIMIGGSRFLLRLLHEKRKIKFDGEAIRVLIVGAGQAGTILARNISRNEFTEYQIVGFVDDDPNKKYLTLVDYRVLGTTSEIEKIVESKGVQEIILAVPSLPKSEMKALFERCSTTSASVKIMPKIEDVLTGKVTVNDMQEVNIEDLLGRDEVKLDMLAISEGITDKVILVTGAGGSIGSEICRQVMKFQPKKLLLLGHGENSIYLIHMELTEQYKDLDIEIMPIIADVQDRDRIFEVIQNYKPNAIYHAAAHKHVPLMEANPLEAIKNNVFGTKNVADAAHKAGVDRFVLVSTDKAVNPPNVMGSTKRIAEMVVQNLATQSKTTFAAVRFGNVLGSRGSVVPRFKAQIAAGGPVTVTHPEMTRYFMTIPEASRLVLQAGALARGGEVFVLDMGEPVYITDLAKNLIRLSGFKEDEISIEYSGIRPGEKMYEELLSPNEIQEEHVYPKIHVGKANCMSPKQLAMFLSELEQQDNPQLKEKVIAVANGHWEVITDLHMDVAATE